MISILHIAWIILSFGNALIFSKEAQPTTNQSPEGFPIILNKGFESQGSKTLSIHVLVDSSRTLAIEEIRQEENLRKFKPSAEVEKPFKRDYIYWGYLAFKNQTNKAFPLKVAFGGARIMHVYVFEDGNLSEIKSTGSLESIDRYDFMANGQGMIIHTFQPGVTTEFFVRLEDHPTGDWGFYFAPELSSVKELVLTCESLRTTCFLGRSLSYSYITC